MSESIAVGVVDQEQPIGIGSRASLEPAATDQSAADVAVAARAGVKPELADHLEARDIGNRGADLEVFLAREAEVGEADAQVFAGRQAILGVEIAAGGRQLEGAAVGAEPEVGIALGQSRPGAGQPVGQPDAAAVGDRGACRGRAG